MLPLFSNVYAYLYYYQNYAGIILPTNTIPLSVDREHKVVVSERFQCQTSWFTHVTVTVFNGSSATQPIVADVEVKFRRIPLIGIDGGLVQLTEIRESIIINAFNM